MGYDYTLQLTISKIKTNIIEVIFWNSNSISYLLLLVELIVEHQDSQSGKMTVFSSIKFVFLISTKFEFSSTFRN